MLKIYLVRHGQDEDNARGILNGHRNKPLTALGREQADNLAKEIKASGLTFDAVYSSPLARAYATAEAVTGTLGLEKPLVMHHLIERNFGVMTGLPIRDIETLCAPNIMKISPRRGLHLTYFLSPEGAETFPQLVERGKIVIDWVERIHRDGSVLLVTHGDIGKMIYAAYYDLDWKTVLTLFHFGNSELLLLAKDSAPEAAHVFQFEQHNH